MRLPILLVILFLPLMIDVSVQAGEWSREEIEAEEAAERAREEAKKEYQEKGLFYKIWVNFEDSGCDCETYDSLCKRFDIWSGYVVRYGCNFLSQIDYATLTRLSGHEPFVSGPHANGRFNLNSKKDFGHYNEDFVLWVTENMIPGAKDDAFRRFTQPVYHGYLQDLMRVFYAAWVGMKVDSRFRIISGTTYRHFINTGSWGPDDPVAKVVRSFFLDHVRHDLEDLYGQGGEPYHINQNDFVHGVGFWKRRNIDETEPAFLILFEKLFEVYDRPFLDRSKEILRTYSSARHDEGLSEFVLFHRLAGDLDRDFDVELAGHLDLLTLKDLKLLRNAIFATKGYKFENTDLRVYFEQNIRKFCRSRRCGIILEVFDDTRLTPTDRKNLRLIKTRETEWIGKD